MIAKPSIQSLFLQSGYNGTPIATGTGFVYSKAQNHYLITNRHNVTGRHQETSKPLSSLAAIPNEIQILHNKKGQLGAWHGRIEKLLDTNDTPLWYEHPVHREKMDCVALRLTALDDVDVYSYNEYDSAPNMLIGPADYVRRGNDGDTPFYGGVVDFYLPVRFNFGGVDFVA